MSSAIRPPEMLDRATDERYYNLLATSHNFIPHTIDLPHGGRAFWVGDPSAATVLLYLHGGGYRLALTRGHICYIGALAQSFGNSANDTNVAVFVLSYSLSPAQRYPTQLAQTLAAVRYLLDFHRKRPSDIIFVGDSAGANLTLAVISHVMHPHPFGDAVAEPLSLTEPFKAAALISPAIYPDSAIPGMMEKDKLGKDVLSTPVLLASRIEFLNGAEIDAFVQPGQAPEGWWKGLPSVVEHMLITAGSEEIMLDPIVDFAGELAGIMGEKLKLAVVDGEVHDTVFENSGGHYVLEKGKLPGEDLMIAGEIVRRWLTGVLGAQSGDDDGVHM